jgi:hypothetical protein
LAGAGAGVVVARGAVAVGGFAVDSETASIAPPPVLGCPEGWGSAGTRAAGAEILGLAGLGAVAAAPPLNAWATPPLAWWAAASRAVAACLGVECTECAEDDEVELACLEWTTGRVAAAVRAGELGGAGRADGAVITGGADGWTAAAFAARAGSTARPTAGAVSACARPAPPRNATRSGVA